MNDFNQTINRIKEFVYSDQIFMTFNEHEITMFKKTILDMEGHIREAMADTSPIVQDQQIKEIRQSLQYMITRFLTTKITQDSNRFLNQYLLLASNWEQAIGGCELVSDQVIALSNLLEYHSSVMASVEVLRSLTHEAQRFMKFNPPAFEISRHYLQSIEERLNKK